MPRRNLFGPLGGEAVSLPRRTVISSVTSPMAQIIVDLLSAGGKGYSKQGIQFRVFTLAYPSNQDSTAESTREEGQKRQEALTN